jgi:seryl-tRNA(Sec) selenium transferase
MQDTIIARRRRRAGVDSLLIAGASAAAAGASLIGYVNSVAEECGIKLLSTSVRVDSARRGLSRVTVRISTVTDGQGVGELVSELETGAPMIAVREMTITGTDAGAPPTRAEALRLDLLLEGLAQIGEKAGAAAVAHLRAVAEKTP